MDRNIGALRVYGVPWVCCIKVVRKRAEGSVDSMGPQEQRGILDIGLYRSTT